MNKHLSSIKKTAVLVAVSWLAIPAFAGIGGFVDAQVGGAQYSGMPDKTLNSEIADAAVYLSKELGNGKLMIDLPFSFTAANADGTVLEQQVEAIPAPIGPGVDVQPYATAFRAFNTKAQAYISWAYDFGLSWQLGRFDSPFLNEANDTVGLGAFATQGTLFAALPRMHNGLMLTYGQGPVTVMGLASRRDGNVRGREAGENLEYGVLGKYTHDMGYLGAGLYLHKPGTTATPNTESHSIIEVMAGTKMSDWTVDAQALFTSAAATGNNKSGFGIGGTINYQWDKMWSVGVRPQYLSKVVTNNGEAGAQLLGEQPGLVISSWHQAVTPEKSFQVTVGPQAQMTDDLRLRANYTWTSSKGNDNDKSVSDSEWTLSAVYKF